MEQLAENQWNRFRNFSCAVSKLPLPAGITDGISRLWPVFFRNTQCLSELLALKRHRRLFMLQASEICSPYKQQPNNPAADTNTSYSQSSPSLALRNHCLALDSFSLFSNAPRWEDESTRNVLRDIKHPDGSSRRVRLLLFVSLGSKSLLATYWVSISTLQNKDMLWYDYRIQNISGWGSFHISQGWAICQFYQGELYHDNYRYGFIAHPLAPDD